MTATLDAFQLLINLMDNLECDARDCGWNDGACICSEVADALFARVMGWD